MARSEELPLVKRYLSGLLSWSLQDADGVDAAIRDLLDGAQAEVPPLAYSFGTTLQGLMAWQNGDAEAALVTLDRAQLNVPFHVRVRSPLYEQMLNRYICAEAFYRQGQLRDALRWFRALYDGYYHWGVVYLPLAYQRRAELHAHLGDEAAAADYQARLEALWNEPDAGVHLP